MHCIPPVKFLCINFLNYYFILLNNNITTILREYIIRITITTKKLFCGKIKLYKFDYNIVLFECGGSNIYEE